MADEDERWLYGDCNQDEEEQEKEASEAVENTSTEVSINCITKYDFR